MGNGVPNQNVCQHRQSGAGVVGYRMQYHDQMVTGSNWPMSPEISPSDYATIRAAAAQSQVAFDAAVAASGWAPFFANFTLDTNEARLGVLDVL